MEKTLIATSLCLAAALGTTAANAALLSRLGGAALYDDSANLTWLRDSNYAKTSGYDADGVMNWDAANTWAGSLNIDGVTGWRLPGGPMEWENIRTSEMGNLYYNVLGGVFGRYLEFWHNANYDLFSNVDPGSSYWSGVEFDSGHAWTFSFFSGNWFDAVPKSVNNFGWAVHSGDVSSVAVPPPALLLISALGALGLMRRRIA